MAIRLGSLVIDGQLRNTSKNSVRGQVRLRGMEQVLVLELTGNCDPDLAGRHVRFQARPDRTQHEDPSDAPDLSTFSWRQIGPTATMTANHKVRIFDCSTQEFLIRSRLNEPPPMRWVRCLYLEWYGQHGRVVIELPDPVLEFIDRADLPGVRMSDDEPNLEATDPDDPPQGALGVTTFRVGEDGETAIRHEVLQSPGPDSEDERPPDDPFGLLPDDLQRTLDSQAAEVDRAIGADGEVSQAIREMELDDSLIDHGPSVPVCNIFEEPMRLPPVEGLSDEQAETALKTVLTQLALFGIALDMCEHYTPRDAYRLLVEEVLCDEEVFPPLRGTQWVTHFMTSEFCEICQREIQRELEEFERKRRRNTGDKRPPDGRASDASTPAP